MWYNPLEVLTSKLYHYHLNRYLNSISEIYMVPFRMQHAFLKKFLEL